MQEENKNKKTSPINIKKLTIIAMLIAIGVVIGFICKSFLDFGGVFRITFENLTILMAGIFYGPLVGGIVGFSVDFIAAIMSAQSMLPLITLASTLVGVISGIISHYVYKEKGTTQIILSASIAHIICSMIIKPIALYPIYSDAVFFRIPIYLIIAPTEILIICMLHSNSSFMHLIEDKESI